MLGVGPGQAAHLLHRRCSGWRGGVEQGCERGEGVRQRPVVVALLPYVQRLIQRQRRLLRAAGGGLSATVVIVSQCKESKEMVRHRESAGGPSWQSKGSARWQLTKCPPTADLEGYRSP
jgi:hypothetical protein